MVIKNVIFDIGNVLLMWQPQCVVERVFPQYDKVLLTQKLFKSSYWLDLNLGKYTENELIEIYNKEIGLPIPQLKGLMAQIKESLLPIPGSFELLKGLHDKGVPLYCITDNVREIIIFIKKKYEIWSLFKGIVISAEIGYLKPAKEIYQHLLEKYKLKAKESLFFDDVIQNIQGAKDVGIHAIQFTNAEKCKEDINRELRLNL